MHPVLDALHANSAQFPPLVTAIKLAIAIAIGLLIGFERQWANKDFGVRTFSFAALLGALTAFLPLPVLLTALAGVIALAVVLNLRDILASRSVEGTTSLALILTFILGALCGLGHLFTATACGIMVTWLLSLKPQFRAFAGGLKTEEIRSALVLGLFGFVVWPLLPARHIDPWSLFYPREAWTTVLVVACIGFLNYLLLRLYGAKGVSLSAVLGGLVNSTATATELLLRLPAAGLGEDETISAVLLTSVAMFARNLLLLVIFAPSAVRDAALPLSAMSLVSGWFLWKRRAHRSEEEITLTLDSPVSIAKVLQFGGLFVTIQVLGTAATRFIGSAGLILVSLVGGAASSASATAAAANLSAHGQATPLQAAVATIVASMVSTTMSPIVASRRLPGTSTAHRLWVATALQILCGLAAMAAQYLLIASLRGVHAA